MQINSQMSNIKTCLSPDEQFVNHAHAMSRGKKSNMKTREYDSTNMALEHSTKLIQDGNHVESQLTRSKTGSARTGEPEMISKKKNHSTLHSIKPCQLIIYFSQVRQQWIQLVYTCHLN